MATLVCRCHFTHLDLYRDSSFPEYFCDDLTLVLPCNPRLHILEIFSLTKLNSKERVKQFRTTYAHLFLFQLKLCRIKKNLEHADPFDVVFKCMIKWLYHRVGSHEKGADTVLPRYVWSEDGFSWAAPASFLHPLEIFCTTPFWKICTPPKINGPS